MTSAGLIDCDAVPNVNRKSVFIPQEAQSDFNFFIYRFCDVLQLMHMVTFLTIRVSATKKDPHHYDFCIKITYRWISYFNLTTLYLYQIYFHLIEGKK